MVVAVVNCVKFSSKFNTVVWSKLRESDISRKNDVSTAATEEWLFRVSDIPDEDDIVDCVDVDVSYDVINDVLMMIVEEETRAFWSIESPNQTSTKAMLKVKTLQLYLCRKRDLERFFFQHKNYNMFRSRKLMYFARHPYQTALIIIVRGKMFKEMFTRNVSCGLYVTFPTFHTQLNILDPSH